MDHLYAVVTNISNDTRAVSPNFKFPYNQGQTTLGEGKRNGQRWSDPGLLESIAS